jgi:hypothetical protein
MNYHPVQDDLQFLVFFEFKGRLKISKTSSGSKVGSTTYDAHGPISLTLSWDCPPSHFGDHNQIFKNRYFSTENNIVFV